MSPLASVTVVEFAGSVAGAQTARLFKLGGADVAVIGTDELTWPQRTYLRQGMRMIDDGRHDQAIDWSTVDVVIESSAPDPLRRRAVDAPQAVRVRLSPFGPVGPYAQWRATDVIDYAISGHSYLYGDPDRAPLAGPPDQPAVACGLYGFIGAMAALFARTSTGQPPTVDVNHAQVMAALHQVTVLRWTLTGDVLRRMGNRYTGVGQPNGPYACLDGIVSIAGITEPQVDGLLAVTGLTHLLDDPRITSPLDFYHHPELLDEPLRRWLADQRAGDVVELFQAMRIPACPLRTPLELLDDPQLVARDFFEPAVAPSPARGGVAGTRPPVLVPRSPMRFSNEQAMSRASRAPWQPGAAASDETNGPLSGLVVLDLTRVWAGPLCTRILADLGADVIMVEAPWARGLRQIPQPVLDATGYFPDNEGGERPWNRNGHVAKFGLGKRSLAVNLQHRDGMAAFERLVPAADVLVENFSSRVMPQFGLDEARLHALHPGLIYVTMPGYGRSGPAEHWLAYGSSVDSHAGLSALIGYHDATPWKGGVAWPDPLAGLHACAAVLMQVWARATDRSGGCTIEIAQFEATVASIGAQIVAAQTDATPHALAAEAGSAASASTSTDTAARHEGTYRCLGDDAWLAVSVLHEAGAAAVLELAAQRSTTPFDTLDDALGSLAASAQRAELAAELQALGVAAASVHAAPALLADPHLNALDAWVTIDQPDIGPLTTAATPLHLSSGGVAVRRPAPTLGEHNHAVLAMAGLGAPQIAALAADGVIATEPPR